MRKLCILALALGLGGCDAQSVGVDVGRKAPEITGETVSAVPVKLSQYQGKVVLLDFWASWCGPCMGEMPHTLDLHRQYDGRPFAVLGVNRDRTREDLKRYLDVNKLPWQNAFDAGGNIADQWNVSGFPT